MKYVHEWRENTIKKVKQIRWMDERNWTDTRPVNHLNDGDSMLNDMDTE
jgi:hypothetical protein